MNVLIISAHNVTSNMPLHTYQCSSRNEKRRRSCNQYSIVFHLHQYSRTASNISSFIYM